MYLNDTGYDLLTKFLTMDPSQVRERRVGERREGRVRRGKNRRELTGEKREGGDRVGVVGESLGAILLCRSTLSDFESYERVVIEQHIQLFLSIR